MRPAVLVLSLCALAACSRKPTEPEPAATARAPAEPPSAAAAAAAAEHACANDADCTNSCLHGAVNRAWWERTYPGGEACEDGCTSKGTDPARCEAGSCVAYVSGARSDECTKRRRAPLPGPGPAHRCSSDDDCRTSCRYGAVNREWYSYGATNECKDGCASKGDSARCEGGACVAYAGAKRNDLCTRRSIHVRE